MNDMNELTGKLKQIMVPKAALIAYEYRENNYRSGTYYLELHPINDRGRMEAAAPVTYEFMNALVESYMDDRLNVPHGKSPPTCCGVMSARGTRGISGTIRPENGRCSLPEA